MGNHSAFNSLINRRHCDFGDIYAHKSCKQVHQIFKKPDQSWLLWRTQTQSVTKQLLNQKWARRSLDRAAGKGETWLWRGDRLDKEKGGKEKDQSSQINRSECLCASKGSYDTESSISTLWYYFKRQQMMYKIHCERVILKYSISCFKLL